MTLVSLVTGWVVTVKLALDAPSKTVTFAGVEATEGLPLDKVTSAPPAGAGPVRVTVPVAGFPPPTVDGLTVSDKIPSVEGVTVNVAFLVWPPKEPEIVTLVVELTTKVVTGNVAVLDPGATVTVAGTAATEVLLFERVNTAPLGAAALRVTVAVEVPPLATVVGFRLREDMEMAFEAPWFTVTNSELLMLPPCPSLTVRVMVTTVCAATTGGLKVTLDPDPVILPALVVQL
jgi:hypothetical protein